MTARAQAKLFAPKKFPKGLASAGQICFQLTPGQTHAVWKDYCEIVHPHGPEWTVKYLNDGGKLDVPKKELGLAIQPGQEITLKGRFVNLSHYAKNKAHFVYTDCISGDESEYESAKKKRVTRSSTTQKKTSRKSRSSSKKTSQRKSKKKPADKSNPPKDPKNTATVQVQKETAKQSPVDPKETAELTQFTPAAHELVEALAVGAAKALTKPCDPDNESVDDQHLRIGSGLAAVVQNKEVVAWLKCPFKALKMNTKATLGKIYSEKTIDYIFTERVVQAYASLQNDKKEHDNTYKVLLAAVQQTLPQVRPPSKRPHGGSATIIANTLLPTVQKLYGVQPKSSDSGYTGHLKKTGYTFTQACENAELMEHFQSTMMKKGDKDGFPVVQEGESVPSEVYDGFTEVTVGFKAMARKPHPEVPFCRYVALRDAVDYVRNCGESPIQVRAREMPTGVTWNNFARPLWMLLAKYCSNQGYARTSDMARKCALFFFHGSYVWKTRNSQKAPVSKIKPFVFFLHKKMVAQRSRFVAKVVTRAIKKYKCIIASNDFQSLLATIRKSLLAMLYCILMIASNDFCFVASNDSKPLLTTILIIVASNVVLGFDDC